MKAVIHDPQTLTAQAESCLSAIAKSARALDLARQQAQAELAAFRMEMEEKLAMAEAAFKADEQALMAFAKKNRAAIFDGRDRADFSNGSLMLQVIRRVRRARSVTVELLESLNLGAVKTAKSVDWDAIEHWPLERLVLIGTGRAVSEKIEYELNNS